MEMRTIRISTGRDRRSRRGRENSLYTGKPMEEVVVVQRENWDKDDQGRFIHAANSVTIHRPAEGGPK